MSRERGPDRAKVKVVWRCDKCQRWVRAALDRERHDYLARSRAPFHCESCVKADQYSGGLFGEWLEENGGRGR